MKVWQFIYDSLQQSKTVMLLYVLQSSGSSPGRQGFNMAVNSDGDFCGTIGGGIMEHKLVEWSKELLAKGETQVHVKQQHHNKEGAKDQSGMICSGAQLMAFVPLSGNDLSSVKCILACYRHVNSTSPYKLILSKNGLGVSQNHDDTLTRNYFENPSWEYHEILQVQNIIHIIGGGHVGLALSQVMAMLDYFVIIYDDRADLNTMKMNTFAHKQHILDYKDLGKKMNSQAQDCVAIVTFSYRSDKVVLEQLYQQPFAYIGMMGSDSKIDTLYAELAEAGISKLDIQHVRAPIGLPIFSKNTMEIAISIAGEIIKEKNKNLPTGRKYS